MRKTEKDRWRFAVPFCLQHIQFCTCMWLLFMCVILVSCYCNSSSSVVLAPPLLYLHRAQLGNGKEVVSILLLTPVDLSHTPPYWWLWFFFQHYITARSLCINSGVKNFPSSICSQDEELVLHTCGCAPFIWQPKGTILDAKSLLPDVRAISSFHALLVYFLEVVDFAMCNWNKFKKKMNVPNVNFWESK